MALALATTGLLSNADGLVDCAFVHPEELKKLATAGGVDPEAALKRGLLCSVGSAVLYTKVNPSAPPGKICVGMMHRLAGELPLDKQVPVSPFFPPADAFVLASISVEIAPISNNSPITIDAADLAAQIQSSFKGHVYKVGQAFALAYQVDGSATVNLKATVKGMEWLDVSGSAPGGAAGGAGAVSSTFGQLVKATEIQISKAAAAANVKLTGSSTGKANKLFNKGFNFEELGIGGLDAQFKDIFRRAFASRLVPPDVLRRMGQNHVRGMLLYGPPGCGKTLIARKIGKALHARPPKIVNGPEILNKYVGQSEENIRALFKDAEEEQRDKGDDSELHIIILDEMDAIARQRGTTGGGTGVNDSIVNQFLSKIDGVDALNNILIIGMTNRKDMIDEAILRPGRLELHVEIGLPDEPGRAQILSIHTAELRKNGMLAPDVSIASVAARTKNYTGAELEGLVKAACSYVFARQTDLSNLDAIPSFEGVQVTMEDFDRALSETQPAFGVREEELAQCCAGGIIPHGEEFARVYGTLSRLAQQVLTSERTPLVSVLLTGPGGSGKSALAARIAQESGFPFIKRISGESLLSLHEEGKAHAVARVFNDAYKSPASLVIIDDVERVMEYVAVGPRFSNTVLQSLLVLVKALPPAGHRLMIVGTTAVPDMLSAMEITTSFGLSLEVPLLDTEEQYRSVLGAAETGMPAADVESIARHMAGKPLGIKKFLNILEMARQQEEDAAALGGGAAGGGNASPAAGARARPPVSAESIMQALIEWGL